MELNTTEFYEQYLSTKDTEENDSVLDYFDGVLDNTLDSSSTLSEINSFSNFDNLSDMTDMSYIEENFDEDDICENPWEVLSV
jgi:hypothetical protein